MVNIQRYFTEEDRGTIDAHARHGTLARGMGRVMGGLDVCFCDHAGWIEESRCLVGRGAVADGPP